MSVSLAITILVGGNDAAGLPVVIKLSTAGVQDQSFGTNGVYHGPLTDLSGPKTVTASMVGGTAPALRHGKGIAHPFDGGCCGGGGGCCSSSYSAPSVSFSANPYNSDEGATFSGGGTISDDNPNQDLSATVDYNDGTGSHPLTINSDGSFSLSDTYAEDASYNVQVNVTDSNDNESGGGNVSVEAEKVTSTFATTGLRGVYDVAYWAVAGWGCTEWVSCRRECSPGYRSGLPGGLSG